MDGLGSRDATILATYLSMLGLIDLLAGVDGMLIDWRLRVLILLFFRRAGIRL